MDDCSLIPESGRELRLMLKSKGKYALLYSASEIQFLLRSDIPFVFWIDVLNTRPMEKLNIFLKRSFKRSRWQHFYWIKNLF